MTNNVLMDYLEEAHGALVAAAKEAHLTKHPQAAAISKLIDALEEIDLEVCGNEPLNNTSAEALELENKKLKQELEEAQNKLKKTITNLDLAGIELYKWERDFNTIVRDFKSFVESVKRQ